MQNQQTIQEIVKHLKSTFSGSTNNQIQQSQQKLKKQLSKHPLFLDHLISILVNASDREFKLMAAKIKDSASIYLKGFIFDITYKCLPDDTAQILTKLYMLLIDANATSHRIKFHVSNAIQYILNKDARNIYKYDFLMKVLQDLEICQNIVSLDGILLAYRSSLCSLIEISDKFQFVDRTFVSLKNVAIKLFVLLESFKDDQNLNSNDTHTEGSYLNIRNTLLTIETFYQTLEFLIERIEQEEQDGIEMMNTIRFDQDMKKILCCYLEYKSSKNPDTRNIIIINCKFTHQINKIKERVISIIHSLYQEDVSRDVIELCYFTFSNCLYCDFSAQNQETRIFQKVIQILDTHCLKNSYYGLFSVISLDIFFKILMYSKTSVYQISLTKEDPKQFVELAEDYCQFFTGNQIKIRMASFLNSMVDKIDGMLNNIFHICMFLIRNAIKQEQLIQEALEQYKEYDIIHCSKQVQMEVSLMCLSLLHDKIRQRKDLFLNFKVFMASLYQYFLKEENQIVLLRLINLIGFTRLFEYLPIIENNIQKNELFRLQSFSSLNRFFKAKLELQEEALLLITFNNLIHFITPNDRIFQNLVLKHDNMIRSSNELCQKCIKILILYIEQEIYKQDLQNQNMHNYMNLMSGIVIKQFNQMVLQEIQDLFFKIKLKGIINRDVYQKFVEIAEIFISKRAVINQNHKRFVLFTVQNIHQFYKSKYLYFYYNKYINLAKNVDTIQMVLQTLCRMLFLEDFQNKILVRHVTKLIYQIILKFQHLSYLEQIHQGLYKKFNITTDQAIKGWIINVLIASFYANAKATYSNLNKMDKYVDFLTEVLQSKYFEELLTVKDEQERKIYIIGMSSLLQLQIENKNQNIYVTIFLSVLELLNKQKQINIEKAKKLYKIQSKKKKSETEQLQILQQSNNKQDNHEDMPFSTEFKNPFEHENEFQRFQNLWHRIKELLIMKVRQILQIYKNNENVTRRVFKLKK